MFRVKRFLAGVILAGLILVALPSVSNAAYVRGYYRSNGTYVQPYYRSNPNGLKYDNYSYKPSQPLYNDSYGRYNTYKWNTPSYKTQPDYYSGLNSYRSNNLNRSYSGSSYWDY
jgi:hypothetical protein